MVCVVGLSSLNVSTSDTTAYLQCLNPRIALGHSCLRRFSMGEPLSLLANYRHSLYVSFPDRIFSLKTTQAELSKNLKLWTTSSSLERRGSFLWDQGCAIPLERNGQQFSLQVQGQVTPVKMRRDQWRGEGGESAKTRPLPPGSSTTRL